MTEQAAERKPTSFSIRAEHAKKLIERQRRELAEIDQLLMENS